MRVIFMGTPLFGKRVLEELIKEHEVVLVVTQPDTYKGKKVIFSPVKEFALEHGIEVYQPQKIKLEQEKILSTVCDVIVTAAYGQIVPVSILNHPKYHAINVHGSLLPKYRGGAPIQRAIINGDKTSGITIMYMDKGMDTGDILEQSSLSIEGLTADEAFTRLASLGASMINPFLAKLEIGEINPIKQDESLVSYAYNITKEEELIDFTKDALSIYNLVRGLSSNPGAYFTLNGQIFKIYNCSVVDGSFDVSKISEVTKNYCLIGTSNGAIKIESLKPEGKNLLSFRDYYNGKGKELFKENMEVNK